MTGSEANTGAMSEVAESQEKVRLQCALYWRGVGQPETARYVRRNKSEMLQIKGGRCHSGNLVSAHRHRERSEIPFDSLDIDPGPAYGPVPRHLGHA